MEEEITLSDEGKEVEELNSKIQVKIILNQLPLIQKRVVELRIEGFTFREISKKIGKSEAHSRKLKQLAKNKIKKFLSPTL